MKLGHACTALILGLAGYSHAQGSIDEWAPGGLDDFRGPCPMMNTLANHGFLPHDGKDLTEDKVIHALGSALGFDEALAKIMFQQALPANPDPNATFFTLDQLNRHNVLEHDASMSRLDAYFGNNHVFNADIFAQTTAYWTEDILDTKQLANGKLIRQINSRAANPTYTFTETTEAFSLGEVAAPIIVFGSFDTATVNRTIVEFFFENERLPTALGWTKKPNVTLENITEMSEAVGSATSLFTESSNSTTSSNNTATKRRRDLHCPFGFA